MEVVRSSNSIIFSKPYPNELLDKMIDGIPLGPEVEIFEEPDERVNGYSRSISFSSKGEKSQEAFERFLRSLSFKGDLRELVWAYQVEFVAKIPKVVKLDLPSVLPLVGNVMLTGVVIANVRNLDTAQRKFTLVQVDNNVRVLKRDEQYVSLSELLREAELLVKTLWGDGSELRKIKF
ncbi:hypothetical protein MetMK1DRAFT_00005730 [Metallosphaera yellowstonensis MK1]|jgi:hypothetical protein|uniref:Uncharacterized protein n=1 Tax=Metallosphaera yellowstonensis MK1 TaxID=671065 RepID=H2C1F0_9CREN|nr:hypothetical protein [Metallosphaera yellowstonensis]EHP70071.1 hypothetical protein MetMK1DRAFT_00005730 [Metallosphaera yellowstonensis MK1]